MHAINLVLWEKERERFGGEKEKNPAAKPKPDGTDHCSIFNFISLKALLPS